MMKVNSKILLIVVGMYLSTNQFVLAQEFSQLPSLPPLPPLSGKLFIKKNEQRFQDLKSKEVSVETNINKGADVYIDNTSRVLDIKTWDQPKVKVVTTVFYEGDANKLSDEEWFEKLNLSVKSLGNSVRIKSGTVSSGGSYQIMGNSYSWSSGPANGVAIFNSNGETVGTKNNTKRYVTIYLPKDNKLAIESKYADITISTNLAKLAADITNGNLEMQDVNVLSLRSKYANVFTGNIKNGEVEFINGRFSAKEVDDLEIDTKYSTIEIGSVDKLSFISTNDEYEIEEAGSVQARKSYGNLRINKLNKSIELDGTNADIKIRNLSANVSTIKFDNKYADMRIPLRNIKSYTVNYVGPYSTVYCNFEKKPFTGKELKSSKVKDALADQLRDINQSIERSKGNDGLDDKFSASVGDGKGAAIDIRCQNCTVDFK